jgi:Transposase, Mutator family
LKTKVPPSEVLEQAIAELLNDGIADGEKLALIGRLGAQLVLQKGVEDEVDDFLQRVRYQRTEEARGARNGNRPKRVMTAEGELEIQMPQLRNTAEKFASRIIPDLGMAIRTRPLEVLIIGAYVRGLSDRDIESLLKGAGLGHGFQDDRQPDLPGAPLPLCRLQSQEPGQDRSPGAIPRRHLPPDQAERGQGGRACGVGLHDDRGTSSA